MRCCNCANKFSHAGAVGKLHHFPLAARDLAQHPQINNAYLHRDLRIAQALRIPPRPVSRLRRSARFRGSSPFRSDRPFHPLTPIAPSTFLRTCTRFTRQAFRTRNIHASRSGASLPTTSTSGAHPALLHFASTRPTFLLSVRFLLTGRTLLSSSTGAAS